MPSCKDITALLTDYLEGEMQLGDRMVLRAHLLMCPPCRRFLEQLELCIHSCRRLPPPDVDEGHHDALMKAFRYWSMREGDIPP